jgi:hypothetical protein
VQRFSPSSVAPLEDGRRWNAPLNDDNTTDSMKNQRMLDKRTDRRSFLRTGFLTAAGAGAMNALAPEAQAAFGPSNGPTEMAVTLNAGSVRLSQRIYVTAVLRRLDGSGAGLAGLQAQF